MAAISNNLNQGPNLDAFRERSNGTHNVGELKLENGVLKIVNNHVWKTGENDDILSADEKRDVREALFRAFSKEIRDLNQRDLNPGRSGELLLAAAEEILLGKNAEKSLTREVTRLLCEAEQRFRDEVDQAFPHDRSVGSDLRDKVKTLAERSVRHLAAQDVVRSSRDAAFRLTVNERRDRLLDLLGQYYLGEHNHSLKERCEELKAFLFGTDEEAAKIKADNTRHPDPETINKLNRYRTWLRKFDAKAVDADGKTVSDETALNDLGNALNMDKSFHGVPNPAKRRSAVEGLLEKLFGLKGGKGKAEQERLRSLLIDDKAPANAFERQVVKFKPWLTGGRVVLMEGADVNGSPLLDDEVLEKLQVILVSLSGSFEGMPVENRQGFVREALTEIFNGKGGEGDAAKVRLSAILFGEDTPDNLTSGEKEIAKFREWLHDYDVPKTDGNGKAMKDWDAFKQLKALLKGVGDSVGPISQKERKAAVVSVLNKLDNKGGYGLVVKDRLSTILFVPGPSDDLTSDEKEIAKFKDWVKKFEVPMRNEKGEVITDRTALEQLETLLMAKIDSVKPMSEDERGEAVQRLLDRHFSQGGMCQVVKKRLERIFDKGVQSEYLSDDEMALLDDNEKLDEFRTWRKNFGAAVELDGAMLSDQEALDRLEKLFEKLAESVKPMSVEERQKAAKDDLEELFKTEGDYGPEMKAAKERLETILFGDEEPDPAGYRDDTEHSLGTIYRKWLHDANAVAEYTEDMGSADALKLKSTQLSDGGGRRHLRDLLQKVADGVRSKSLDMPGEAVQEKSDEEKKSELLDGVIAGLQKDKQRLLDDLKVRYDAAWEGLSGELKNMKGDAARALAWWQRTHGPNFSALWVGAVNDAKLDIEPIMAADLKKLDPEEVKKEFAKALNESLNAQVDARIKELRDMANKVKGYMETLVSGARSRIGNLQVLKTATEEQRKQVLEALPGELESRVSRYVKSPDDENVPLCRLIVGEEHAVDRLFEEVEAWAKGRIDELRKAETEKLEAFRTQVQRLRQNCLREGRMEALRQIVKANRAFATMTLSDEDLEQSVGRHPGLSLDDLSGDEDIRRLLGSRAETLQPSDLAGSDEGRAAFDQVKKDIVTLIVERFTGTTHSVVSGQIGAYAKPIRDAREKDFPTRGDLDMLANELTKGVVKGLVDYFKPSFWVKNPNLSKRWLSSADEPAEFDEALLTRVFGLIKKPVKVCMQSIYINHGVVTEGNEALKRECERIGNLARDLLDGFSSLYWNLAVDAKNFSVSGLFHQSKEYFVVAEGEDEKTVRAVMRREALNALYDLMENPHDYLNDPAKLKEAIAAAARNVVEDKSVESLWRTHKHDERNTEVYKALLKLG